MIQALLSLLSAVITLYTILCFIDILLSWIPGLKFTRFGHFVCSLCDPYLNFFSKWGWLRFGNIDFSPIVSIGLLSAVSSILAGIQGTGRIYFGGILATIIKMIWSIVSSLGSILLLLIFIRWLVLLINKGQTSYDSGWNQIDTILNKITYRISGTFIKSGTSYLKSLLISWIVLAVIMLFGGFLIEILVNLCFQMPF